MKLLPTLLGAASVAALPLCPDFRSTFVDSHDGVVNDKGQLFQSFWNRVWKYPSTSKTPLKYGSVYEKFLPKPSKFGFKENPSLMDKGMGTIEEFLDEELLGTETLRWLDCRTKVVPTNIGTQFAAREMTNND